jgi:hypothetical protein
MIGDDCQNQTRGTNHQLRPGPGLFCRGAGSRRKFSCLAAHKNRNSCASFWSDCRTRLSYWSFGCSWSRLCTWR